MLLLALLIGAFAAAVAYWRGARLGTTLLVGGLAFLAASAVLLAVSYPVSLVPEAALE
jgi:hypothetical protein